MYRKRRNRGTWLPTLGTTRSEDDTYLWGFGTTLTVPSGANSTDINTVIIPITADNPTYQGDNVGQSTTMAEAIGNEYFLDRIVGKCFLQYSPALDGTGQVVGGPIICAAGFFVARADDSNPLLPVGANTQAEVRDNYSPLDVDTCREPWIWRRAWVLGTAGSARTAGGIALNPGGWDVAAFPSSNALCGSVLDGPHVDAKTKRRVGQDDRLFMALSCSFSPFWTDENQTPTTAGVVNMWFDYRLHGALRRARPGGKF